MQKSALLLTVITAFALVACGGSKSSSYTARSATARSSPSSASAMNHMAPSARGTLAPVPAGMSCGNDQLVWANMRSRAYHTSADPLYGRTKHGRYLCMGQARAQGYHAAGTRRSRHGAMMSTPGAEPAPSPT